MSVKQQQKKTVIVGMGLTGLSCARYFLARGEPFVVVDSRRNPPGLAELQALIAASGGGGRKEKTQIELQTGGYPADTLKQAKQLLLSPGVNPDTPPIREAMAAGVPVTGDIGLFLLHVRAPIVAVTGSNGKSTVVALLAQILRAAGKNIGIGGNLDTPDSRPALDLLDEPSNSDKQQPKQPKETYLLELSSFQLQTIGNSDNSLGAEVALLLNLSEDHMDRHGSMQQYLAAKQRVFDGCRKLVVNRDDRHSRPPQSLDVPRWEFAMADPAAVDVQDVQGILGIQRYDGELAIAYRPGKASAADASSTAEQILPLKDLPLPGSHNIANALAATALALSLDTDIAAIRAGLCSFSGLPHRCQRVGVIDGVTFYNDSKATNPGATQAALQGIGEQQQGIGEQQQGKLVLIAGGQGKGADFSCLQSAVARYCKAVILIGEDGKQLAAALSEHSRCSLATTMDEAVHKARQHAVAGDAVLLSPACASFDMYADFRQRGNAFTQTVHALQNIDEPNHEPNHAHAR